MEKKKKVAPSDSSPVIDANSLPAEASLPSLAPGPLAPITQDSLLWMGQLAHSTDRRDARLEASSSGMIQNALADVVTPLSASIDALVVRIVVFHRHIHDMPAMPTDTTEYEVRVEETTDPDSEAETKEEMLEVADEVLNEIEEAMVDAVLYASSVDTSLVVVPSEVTPGIYAQV
uniref:Polyprotein protein n=1 Tax=Solanum tuberosum TaxID=4113 RepID=M1DRJ6_SOLTU